MLIPFNNYVKEEVVTDKSKRHSMKSLEFVRMVKEQKHGCGVLFRLGIASGKGLFVESASSGEVYESGAFLKYFNEHVKVGSVNYDQRKSIAIGYDEAFDALKKNDGLLDYLIEKFPEGIKIQGELINHTTPNKTLVITHLFKLNESWIQDSLLFKDVIGRLKKFDTIGMRFMV